MRSKFGLFVIVMVSVFCVGRLLMACGGGDHSKSQGGGSHSEHSTASPAKNADTHTESHKETTTITENGKKVEPSAPAKAESEKAPEKVAPKKQTECPIMKGKIDPKMFVDYKGMRIYFCCPGCKEPFNKDPEKYIAEMRKAGVEPEKIAPAKTDVKAPEAEKDYYTCSMHPQVKQDKPGKCPICGMDLILKKAEKPAEK